jgi:hypothetical protein
MQEEINHINIKIANKSSKVCQSSNIYEQQQQPIIAFMKNIQTNEVYGMLGAIRFRNLLSS